MAPPHPALLAIASGKKVTNVRDPDELVASAAEHRMTGIVWTQIDQGALSLSRAAEKAIFDADIAHWSHNLQLWAGWNHVSAIGARIGVEMLMAKGIAIEAQYFSRTGERPCSDLDVLIDRAGVRKLEELLAELSIEPAAARRTARLAQIGVVHSAMAFAADASVDLHFDLLKTGLPAIDPAVFWETAVREAGPEGYFQTLGPEVSLLQLLVHLNRDRFRRLLGYVDVQRVLDSGRVDWAAFWSIARREGLQIVASEALRAVQEVVPIEYEPGTERHRIRRSVWRLAWPPRIRLLGGYSRFRFGRRAQILFPLLTVGRGLEAVKATARRIFPNREYLEHIHGPREGRSYLVQLIRVRGEDLIRRVRGPREVSSRSAERS